MTSGPTRGQLTEKRLYLIPGIQQTKGWRGGGIGGVEGIEGTRAGRDGGGALTAKLKLQLPPPPFFGQSTASIFAIFKFTSPCVHGCPRAAP